MQLAAVHKLKDIVSNRWQTRFWLLSLFAGIERAGRSPITLPDLNALIYLANATLPCYEVMSLDATVRKSQDGPIYPRAIWDLDRLVGMLLLEILRSPSSYYARLPNSLTPSSLLLRDANYAEHRVTLGDVVDFGEWNTSNFTQDAVIAMKEGLRTRLDPLAAQRATPRGLSDLLDNPGVALRLYAQYLSTDSEERLTNESE